MKKISVLLFIFILFLSMFFSCSSSVSGTYTLESDDKSYIELKSDGSFFLQQRGHGYHGKYEIEGTSITIKLDGGKAARGKLEGKTIIDDEGLRWVKK